MKKNKVILSLLIAVTLILGCAATCGAVSREYFSSWSEISKISITDAGKRSCASYRRAEKNTLTAQIRNRMFGTVMAQTQCEKLYPQTVKTEYVYDYSSFNPISTVKAYAFYK